MKHYIFHFPLGKYIIWPKWMSFGATPSWRELLRIPHAEHKHPARWAVDRSTANINYTITSLQFFLHAHRRRVTTRHFFPLFCVLLSFFFFVCRNQAEMTQTCRGTISLHSALIHTVDSSTFVITNGGTQTFHIKAANEVERQKWVTALELAKAKSM